MVAVSAAEASSGDPRQISEVDATKDRLERISLLDNSDVDASSSFDESTDVSGGRCCGLLLLEMPLSREQSDGTDACGLKPSAALGRVAAIAQDDAVVMAERRRDDGMVTFVLFIFDRAVPYEVQTEKMTFV